MKDLDKEVVYKIDTLSKKEKNKLYEWLRENDTGWKLEYLEEDIYIYYNNNSNEWLRTSAEKRVFTDAKTLFAPKVNIVNPTKSESEESKYKFQYVESYINDNNTYNIDLIFFKEKKNGLIKVKRVSYLENINKEEEEVTGKVLNGIEDSVIKFLEQCEK